jgi:hypothetical protein
MMGVRGYSMTSLQKLIDMVASVYVLSLSSGTYDDYREYILGVFSSEDKALIAKGEIEAKIQRGKKTTFKDTGWCNHYDPESWELAELSSKDLEDWYDFTMEKSMLEEINKLWIEPFILDCNDFNLKNLR